VTSTEHESIGLVTKPTPTSFVFSLQGHTGRCDTKTSGALRRLVPLVGSLLNCAVERRTCERLCSDAWRSSQAMPYGQCHSDLSDSANRRPGVWPIILRSPARRRDKTAHYRKYISTTWMALSHCWAYTFATATDVAK